MPSDRIQRRIAALLDEADQAADAGDWLRVRGAAEAVLAVDNDNADARALLAMAAPMLAAEPEAAAEPAPEHDDALAARPLPDSFVDGRYRVTGFLGEGGRKQVYLARDGRLNREVAFAVIKTEGLDATGRERIQREAQAMGQLSGDPHIVTIHDVGETDGQPYIVSEYMAGGDVEALLAGAEQHHLPLERVIAIADDVTQALAHAHAAGVVHRDLKPGNIWLAEDGTAKLGDFGLAFAASETRMTTEGTMLGTVAYMPPEQALGNPATPQSDLYALGCVLYELVAGRPPFLGDDAVAVISQHLNTSPVAPSWNRPDCPPALEALILSLLAKAPAERPPSAADVRAELARIDITTPAPSPTAHHNPLDRLARGVFVGREAELQRLRAAFDRSLGGHGELVLLVGEPGIGKTRTAYELETYAKMRGAQVHWGRIHEHSGAPSYWPWVQLGRSLGAALGVGADPAATAMLGDGTGELRRLFPELRQLAPNTPEPADITDPEAAQFRLFDAYATFLRNAGTQVPLMLVLDDLHWADKPSLLLLQHVARELGGMRVCLVGTFRDTDLVRTHPLSETLAALNREAGFERISLRGLTQDECAGYIRAAANVEPSPPVLRRIFEETEGNPFFLAEVVNLMAQEGTIDATSLSDIRIPDGVREALGRRLDRLSEEANDLLQVAAVVGREFPYETLGLLSEADDEGTLRLVEEALEARVIEELDRPGRYRFTHHLMQETLLNELSITRRIRIQGQIGDALERRYGDRADERAARLAQHFVEAATLSRQHAEKAVRYSTLAAQQAELRSAWAEAARHYEDVLTLVSDPSTELDEDEAALLAAHAICARNAGDARGGWRSSMRAIDLYRERGDANRLARVTVEALRQPVPASRSLPLIQQALAGEGLEPRTEAELLASMSSQMEVNQMDQPGGQAWEARARALELIASHGFDDLRAMVEASDGFQARRRGDFADAIRLAEGALPALLEAGDSRQVIYAQNVKSLAMLESGRLQEAITWLSETQAYGARRGHRFAAENEAAYLAQALFLVGDFPAFDALLEQHAHDDTYIRNQLAVARGIARGRLNAALSEMPDPAVAGGIFAFLGPIHATRARVTTLGRPDDMATELAQLHDVLLQVDDGRTAEATLASLDDAILDPATKEAGVLALLDERLPDVEAAFAWGAPAAVARVRGMLAEAGGSLDEAAAAYARAVETCRRAGAPGEEGRSHLQLALLEQQRGKSDAAEAALQHAIPLLEGAEAPYYLDQALRLRLELQGLADADLSTSIDAVAASIDTQRPDLTPQAAPDGTVTLLFSDIEDSTARTAELGDAKWMALLREHNAIVREQLAAHSGYEVKCMGDGFMLAFRSARDGLRCAIAIQRAIAEHNHTAPDPIRVRIGLHTGEAIRESDDFFGTHVNLAARIGGAARGNEILVSGLLKALTESAGEFTFDDGRDLELKGITRAQRVYAVAWA